MRIAFVLCVLFFLITISGCDHKYLDNPLSVHIPEHFPDPNIPNDNQWTKLRIELGRRMFYDKRLSSDGSTSCANCHVVSAAFTDGREKSPGANGKMGKRNAPTLANLAWMPHFMMEGGVPTLELQTLAPVHDTAEMNMNILDVCKQLAADRELNAMSRAAYLHDFDPYVLTRSLAAFQRTFISGDSRYDRFAFQNKPNELTEEEQQGMELFFSDKTNCSTCHSGVFFSDFEFYNIGLSEHYTDKGRQRVSYLPEDAGKFKVPTLRNIELTSPYMHDGSLATLEDVIEFYDKGGKNHPNKDDRIHPLNLTAEEKTRLISFLKSLTDWNFVQNQSFLELLN